ncbi:MAG: phytanoyl-CoA dioxygenase family protein [Chloroflexota bacterium]|nr:phytanoyl-CoA dioxygenase family protein [Chloroflexota bacterium]
MELDETQKQRLYEDGYVHLPGVVPRERVDAALRAINASLGSQGIDPAKLTTFRAQTYTPELRTAPEITGLLNETPLWSLAESAIGPGEIKPVTGGQIALRFPVMDTPPEPRPHIDGMYTPTNGVPKGTIANFTALVGVLLSDLPGTHAGNFTVWPGTHHLYERYFREQGPQALLEGMPPVDLPEPVQVTGRAGDAVLVHYQLAHGIAGNGSPHIRYAIFFRLHHVNHESLHWECMTDIWQEWAGMRDIVHAPAGAR